jgi:very-short-patch-repair endonuclease
MSGINESPLTPTLSREGRGSNRAKILRRNATDAEKLFWQKVRNRQLGGLKFRRQQEITPYIVDFVCMEKRAVVEIDGGQHCESKADAVRDAFLEEQGFTVLRYWNNEVLHNIDGVLENLKNALTSPSPLAGEGRGEGAE